MMRPISFEEGQRARRVAQAVKTPKMKEEEINRLEARFRREREDLLTISDQKLADLAEQRGPTAAALARALAEEAAFIAARPGWDENVFAQALEVPHLADGAGARRLREALTLEDDSPELTDEERLRRWQATLGFQDGQRLGSAVGSLMREGMPFAEARDSVLAAQAGRRATIYRINRAGERVPE